MNVEIGAEAGLFQEKEYINGIFVAVWEDKCKEKTEKNVSEEVGHCFRDWKTVRVTVETREPWIETEKTACG